MRKNLIFTLAAFAMLSTAFVGCKSYDDDVNSLQEQIDKLKTQISEIQTKIEGGSVITGVSSTDEGVTLTFSDGTTATVTNGKDGSTWEIGEDGFWYKDGVKSDYKATGEAGSNGTSVFYRPNLETGCFDKVTVDAEGKETVETTTDSWESTTGGITAVQNEDGSITLSGVEGSEDPIVIGNAGIMLTGMQLIPGVGAELMGHKQVGYISEVVADGEEATDALEQEFKLHYRMNPTSANIDNYKFDFVNFAVAFSTKATGDETSLLNVVKVEADEKGGAAYVTASVNDWTSIIESGKGDVTTAENDSLNMFALQATDKEDATRSITSDYLALHRVEYVASINNDSFEIGQDSAKISSAYGVNIANFVENGILTPRPADFSVAYNGSIDLDSLVSGFYYDAEKIDQVDPAVNGKAISELSSKVVFEYAIEPVKGSDNQTEQEYFVSLDGSVVTPSGNKSAIGRTPIIAVNMYKADTKVKLAKTAYIKLAIAAEPVAPEVQVVDTISVPSKVINYADLFVKGASTTDFTQHYGDNKGIVGLNWKEMNAIYDGLDMTHDDFQKAYPADKRTWSENTVTINGTKYKVGKTWYNEQAPEVDSYSIAYEPNPYAKFGKDTVYMTVTPELAKDAKLVFQFAYEIVAPELPQGILDAYQDSEDKDMAITKGRLVGDAYEMSMNIAEPLAYGGSIEKEASYDSYFAGSTSTSNMVATHTIALMGYEKDKAPRIEGFVAAAAGKEGETQHLTASGATPLEFFGTDKAINTNLNLGLADRMTEESRIYNLERWTIYPNADTSKYAFRVKFINPLTAEFPAIELTDKVGGDAIENVGALVTVKHDSEVIFEEGTPVFVNGIDLTANGTDPRQTYALVLGDEATYHALSLSAPSATSSLTWDNEGTKITKPVVVDHIKYTFSTTYAEWTTEVPVTVVPGNYVAPTQD